MNKKKPGNLSNYQFWKFSAILASQSIVYFLIPFIMAPLFSGQPFWQDIPKAAAKGWAFAQKYVLWVLMLPLTFIKIESRL